MNPTEPDNAETEGLTFRSLGPFEQLRRDQRQKWHSGKRVLVESYLEKDSTLANDTEGVLDLIYQEMLLREEVGEATTAEEYRRRFPKFATELGYLLEVHRAISSADSASRSWLGRTISHYLIERHLGAGAMGEVYLARDIALGRFVALKVLPRGYSPSLRSRLLAEADANSRLQHPAVATFYESGVAAGEAFIAMEYVNGETLRVRLRRGPLPWQEAVATVAFVLEALTHAHAAELLHCDIKPENIMLTGIGTAKLLDFGLAKSLLAGSEAEQPHERLATEAEVVGTAGYISPEQMRGQPLDARCDVFGVGAVLYEALVGRPAFPGKTPAERLVAILTKHVPPIDGGHIPKGLGAIVETALSHDLSLRYGSAAEFLTHLRSVGSSHAIAALPNTVAVIDFSNLSGNPDTNWLGSGIAESLSATLAKLPGLRVVPREPVLAAARASLDSVSRQHEEQFAFVDTAACDEATAVDRVIGFSLGCRWIASGAFEKTVTELRIFARLVDVATGGVKASVKLEGPFEQIFQMQDQLAASVTAWLSQGPHTNGGEAASAPNRDAYECYVRGRRLWHRLEKGTFRQAQAYYEQAIRHDPAHAPTLCSLAALHALQFTFSTESDELELASQYAERAIAADPAMSEARVWLGYVRWRQERMDEALQEVTLSMSDGSDPQEATYFAAYFAGCILLSTGRLCDAVKQFQVAAKLNPNNGWTWVTLGWTHLELGNEHSAIWCLERAAGLEQQGSEPPTAGIEGLLGEMLRRTGKLQDARRYCMRGLDAVEKSDHMYRDTLRGVCLCSLGRTALDQGDMGAATAAFNQAIAHLHGRSRALGGGHLLVQAMAGLAQVREDSTLLDKACHLFVNREQFSFHYFVSCSDDVTVSALRRSAVALGQRARTF